MHNSVTPRMTTKETCYSSESELKGPIDVIADVMQVLMQTHSLNFLPSYECKYEVHKTSIP